MTMQQTQALLDFTTGKIGRPAKYSSRRISDLGDFFYDQTAVGVAIKQNDRLVYEVYEFDVPHDNGQLLFGSTIIHPGKVGIEYFMTKGHFHFKEDVAEMFICLGGEGQVLIQNKEGDTQVLPMAGQEVVYSPPFSGHRLINTGSEEFVVVTIGQADAGHDYGPVLEKGIAKLLVERDDKMEIIDNPRYRIGI